MKNKVTIFGAMILSLLIAGSAFAAAADPTPKTGAKAKPKPAVTASNATGAPVKKKPRHRKHRKLRKHAAVEKQVKKQVTKKP